MPALALENAPLRWSICFSVILALGGGSHLVRNDNENLGGRG